MTERRGEAYELGEQLTVIGPHPRVGDAAPGFLLETFGPETQALRAVRLADTAGRVRGTEDRRRESGVGGRKSEVGNR